VGSDSWTPSNSLKARL